jgi:cell division protein FtsW (lipid II flippase)
VSRRNTELLLLAVVGVAATIAYASVYAARFHDLRRDSIVTGVIFLVLFLVIHLTERRYLPQGDPYLVPLAALLSAIGLTEIYRISPALALKQGEWLLIGVALFVATVLVVRDVGRLAAYRYLIGAVGLVLLALTVVAGTSVNGSRLWIRVAGYLNQNKEMLSVPTARLLGVPVPPLKYFGPLLVMWVLSLVMLVFMKDFGMSLLFMATFIAMIYMATARIAYVVAGALLFAVGAGGAYQYVPHVHERFAIWIDPWKTAATSGYQLLQSLFAMADGGLVGAGFGRGYLLYSNHVPTVPDLQTDFIFSAVANELGLAGGIGLILLYLLFSWRGYHIALQASDGFSKLLAAGLATVFGLQTFIIIGGVTRLIPLTGITLPFVSYGGSSLTANLVLAALLLMVSHHSLVVEAGSTTERLRLAEIV